MTERVTGHLPTPVTSCCPGTREGLPGMAPKKSSQTSVPEPSARSYPSPVPPPGAAVPLARAIRSVLGTNEQDKGAHLTPKLLLE